MRPVFRARLFFALELLLLVAVVLVILIPYSPLSHGLPSRDSGVFLYTGWRVLQGETPYLQIWDHKPPVVYYLDALGLWLTPDSLWGVWLLEAVSLGLAAFVGYQVFKGIYGLFPAVFINFLWLSTVFYLLAGGNLTTEYTLPFQFLLIWLFYRAESKPRYGWIGALIGATSALLFFTRQNAIAIPVAIGVCIVVDRIRSRDLPRLWRDLLVILAGFLVVTTVIVGYFAVKGALPAFWDTAFLYNFSYAEERGPGDRFSALAQGFNQLENTGLAQLAIIGFGCALLVLFFKKEKLRPEVRAVLWMVIAALPLELWMVSLGGRPRIPYFLVLLPVLSVLAGFTIWLIYDSLERDIPKYAGALLAVLMFVSLGAIIFSDYAESTSNYLTYSPTPPIVDYVNRKSAPGDYVLFWGADSVYNFAARRASPSRFVYQTPLYNQKNKDMVMEFLQDVLRNKPRLIILRSDDKLSDFRFAFRDNQIGALMDQIKALYGKTTKLGSWQIYNYSGQ